MRSFPRLLAALLVGCLVLPFAGTRLWMSYAQYEVKRAAKVEVLRGLPASDLVQLSFSAETARQELDWEGADEFAYRGEMYDVVKTYTKGDRLVFLCWPDEAETEVKRRMQELSRLRWQQHPQRPHQQARLLLFVQQLIAPGIPALSATPIAYATSAPVTRLPVAGPPVTIDPPSPPPRFGTHI